MTWYSIEPRTRKCVKGYGFLSFERKYKKQLFYTGIDKNCFKKVVHKTGEYLRNKIGDAVTKLNRDIIVKKNLLKK